MSIVLTPYWSPDEGIQKLKMEARAKTPAAPGLTPPVFSMKAQMDRTLLQLRARTSPIEKYTFLAQVKQADVEAFYKLCLETHAGMRTIGEITPIIYTPTVGDACLQYSKIYRNPEGLFISLKDKGRIGNILRNWPLANEARISVVTDGSRILGLGDLGVNGMPIAVGKLSLYVAGAGCSTLPITLDLGTNNSSNLSDPLYLGLRQLRPSDAEYDAFMDEFITEMRRVYPKLLVQFEDFSTDHAFSYLERFRNSLPLFNDDIQGTGAVVLAGLLSAARLVPIPRNEHRILLFGAGSASVGVAKQLMSFFTIAGMSEEAARSQIWLVDSKGLVYCRQGRDFARRHYTGPPMKDLAEIIKYVKPTGAFTPEVIRQMSQNTSRPIIFPLSNPVRLSECTFTEALIHSNGTAIFASGSPFGSEVIGGVRREAGQGNNMYIFPGLGLGAILCRAKSVTDSMVEASALGLAGSLSWDERALELVYPRVERIREISAHIAVKVIRAAQKAGVDNSTDLKRMDDTLLLEFVKGKMWNP
ncbi:malate dehydrogenase [Suillus subalutaceus]|uniref:malate dehydrogenase n=1 Tax=Suillus subalutaceus TaxID=48586 RepID=UPI001B85C9AB|nr:malate dehydrogenase [Suillus subalutaceus]KAG1862779.1 malate dehydrogenase [Suillus subalutaceus]